MMPGSLKKHFAKLNGKSVANLFIILTVGVLLIMLANSMKKPEAFNAAELLTQAGAKEQNETDITQEETEGIAWLEEKLSNAFAQIEGVGRTSVVLTLQSGKEIIVGADVTSERKQTDDETVESYQSKHIIINDAPLVLKEIEPKIDGVLIIAEGGGNPTIVDKLSKAAQALLNVPAHKIQIFKMQQRK